MRRRAALAALAALAPAGATTRAFAQGACAGHPIRSIQVRTASVVAVEGRAFPSVIQSIANAISWRTHEDVVRRELRFAEGEPCDPARLQESARVLRRQPYIRTAAITTSPAPGDSVDVSVLTRDEWALYGSIRIDTRGPRALKAFGITENDLFGRGMLAQLRYDYYGRHAGITLDVLDRQFLGGRTDAEILGGRSSVGPDWEASWRRTFESEYDRIAWRTAVRYREEPFYLSSTRFGLVIQPLVSEGFELAALGRIGRRGRQIIAGLAISAERMFITDQVLATEPADDSAAAAVLAGRFAERRRVAGSAILGIRDVRFSSHRGVDAVNALEDVREGIELFTIVGRTLGSGAGQQRDVYALADLYLGAGLGHGTLGFLRGRLEGRRLQGSDAWDGVIGAADAFLYRQMGTRAGLVVAAQGAGGWHTSTPFQLLVGNERGMRGFGLAALPAGQRVVVQTEHRYFLGTIFGTVDVGTAAFADLGRGWAGDAPFGEDTGTLVSLGGGVRLGFPSASRYTSRLDVAFPVSGGRGFEVRFTAGRQFGIASSAPADVERSRLPISTINLFGFQRY